MALLTRPTQTKIFGSTALAAELTVFGTATVSTDVDLILKSVEAQRGWGTIGVNGAPPLEWFNALGYGLSYQTAYLFQQGIPQWTALQEFYINSYAVGSNGKLYRSKTGVSGTPNSGNNPTTDATETNWIESIKVDLPAVVKSAVAKTVPVDADLIPLADSAAPFGLKSLSWANIKTVLFGSAALTGVPTAPTAVAGTNSTQLATTAFVATSRRIAQIVNITTGALASGTTIIPADDTIPQQTEGDQYMSLAITPTNANSTLVVTVYAQISSGASAYHTSALFRGSAANAVASALVFITAPNDIQILTFSHHTSAIDTALTTFKFRSGSQVATTTAFNGFSTVRVHGGVVASSITITEYLP